MTTISTELYDALVAAGAPEDKARAAAADHLPVTMLATRIDLEKLRGEFRADLEKLRGEFKAGLEKLRGEIKAGQTELTWQLIIALGVFTSIIVLVQKFG